MKFTLTAAAKEASVSKGTISKAIKSGRLSGDRQEDGSFQIDASELFRVFPRKLEETRSGTNKKPSETVSRVMETGGAEVMMELAVLRVELEATRAALRQEREDRGQERETARETVEDLRKRLDAEQAERRTLQLRLLPSVTETPVERPSTVAASNSVPTSLTFLARFLGRG